MTEQPRRDPTLSDIGHLFLSSLRDRAGGRPERTPPPGEAPRRAGSGAAPPLTALIGAHLGARQRAVARRYASQIEGGPDRVGLIEIDHAELALSCLERGGAAFAPGAYNEDGAGDVMDARQIRDAISELSHDVQRWVVLPLDPRAPEARGVLRAARHWTLLVACDPDGVVAAYRALKGLRDLCVEGERTISLAVVDAAGAAEAEQAQRKLAEVCRQFLSLRVRCEAMTGSGDELQEHPALVVRLTHDKAGPATDAHWREVTDLAARSAPPPPSASDVRSAVIEPASPATEAQQCEPAPEVAPATAPMRRARAASSDAPDAVPPGRFGEVIDLPDGTTDPASLTAAVASSEQSLIACPLPLPALRGTVVAVDRSGLLQLIAAVDGTSPSLAEAGRAYEWLLENRALVAMALPQLRIDALRLPALNLLIEHGRHAAAGLAPLLRQAHVQVRTYRALRWGERHGLLLEAA